MTPIYHDSALNYLPSKSCNEIYNIYAYNERYHESNCTLSAGANSAMVTLSIQLSKKNPWNKTFLKCNKSCGIKVPGAEEYAPYTM
jgi:hypothetical protein